MGGGQFWTPIPQLRGSKLHAETQPTLRVFRFKERPQRIRYALSCNETEANCTDFKKRLMQGDQLVLAFDACPKNIGTIKYGANYALKYWKEGDTWCSELSGPQVGVEGDVNFLRACHANPKEGTIAYSSQPSAITERVRSFIWRPAGRRPSSVT